MRNHLSAADAELWKFGCRTRLLSHVRQQRHGGAVAVQRADIDVGLAGFYGPRRPAGSEIRVRQRAEIFIGPVATLPKIVEIQEGRSRHPERAPNPAGGRALLLDLYF